MGEPFFSRDRITGFVAYPSGDAIAQILSDEVSLLRVLLLSLVGGLVYGYEIPSWFGYIHQRFRHPLARTALAILYFNPLWIARHLFVIAIALDPSVVTSADVITTTLLACLATGIKSFAGAIILSIVGNFVIQSVLTLRYRFLGSAIFSGIMAVYYALSRVLM